MAILNKGHDFSDGDQVTAAKLDSAVDSATFAAGSVDNASTQLSGGAIIVKDSGVTTAKISSSAVTAIKIASNAVTAVKLASDSVTTDKIVDANVTLLKLATTLKDSLYPIGSIYTNAVSADNPSTLIGFGTWVAFGAGRIPVGIDASDTDFDTVEETGGVKTVTLTSDQSGVPAHSHPFNSYNIGGSTPGFINKGVGGPQPGQSGSVTIQNTNNSTAVDATSSHTNLQPYIVVYMWKRTA